MKWRRLRYSANFNRITRSRILSPSTWAICKLTNAGGKRSIKPLWPQRTVQALQLRALAKDRQEVIIFDGWAQRKRRKFYFSYQTSMEKNFSLPTQLEKFFWAMYHRACAVFRHSWFSHRRCRNNYKEPHSSGIVLCRVVVVGYEKLSFRAFQV